MIFTYKEHTALVHWSTLPIGVVFDIEGVAIKWHRGGLDYTYTKARRESKSKIRFFRSGGFHGAAYNEEGYACIPLLRIKGVSR